VTDLKLLPGGKEEDDYEDHAAAHVMNRFKEAERNVLAAGLDALLTTGDLDAAKSALSEHGVDPDSSFGEAFLLFIQFEADAINEDSEDPEDDPPRSA